MSTQNKCPDCGAYDVPKWSHEPGGLHCLRNQLAQANDKLTAAEKDLRLLESLTQLNVVVGDSLRKLLADTQAERDQWRNLVALICGDGGQYHGKHGTDKTYEHCGAVLMELKRPADDAIAERDRLQRIVDKLRKTDDGVPLCPRDTCWVVARDRWAERDDPTEVLECIYWQGGGDDCFNPEFSVVEDASAPQWEFFDVESVWSTREAAEKAKGAADGK